MKSFAVILLTVIVGYTSATVVQAPANRNIIDNIYNVVNNTMSTVEAVVDSTWDRLSAFNQQLVTDAMEAFKKMKSIDLCKIKESSLECCVSVRNNTVCSNVVTANGPDGLSLSYVLKLNSMELFKRTLDTSSLPLTQCVPLPPVPVVQLCLTPFNLTLSSTKISSCFELSAKVVTTTLLGVNLHCYQLSNRTLSVLPPSNGPSQAVLSFNTGFLPTPPPLSIPLVDQISGYFSYLG